MPTSAPARASSFRLGSLLLLLCLPSFLAWGQNNAYESAEDSDPEAKALLERMRQKYDRLDPLRAAFSLEIQIPEQPAETQQGTMLRSGDKYWLKLGSQEVIADGEALYLIMHRNKEVQINEMPEEGEGQGALTPQALLRLHESDQFVYVMGGRVSRDGKLLQQIEFKPLDPYSDYSKMRMEIDPRAVELISVTAFGKDGSRYLFRMEELGTMTESTDGAFTFRKDDYPGYYVEDLRN